MEQDALVYSVVIPVFNEAYNLPHLYARLRRVFKNIHSSYEVIFVDDGSSDTSYPILREIALFDHRVTVLSFVKNFGQHYAVVAGLLQAQGDYIITLDSDLQNPPEEIPRLLEKIKEGFDMVSGLRRMRRDSPLRKFSSLLVNLIIWAKTGLRMKDYGSMLRVFTKDTAYALADAFYQSRGYITMLIPEVTHNVAEVSVMHDMRKGGTSKYNLRKLFAYVLKIMCHRKCKGFSDPQTRDFSRHFIIERSIQDGKETIFRP